MSAPVSTRWESVISQPSCLILFENATTFLCFFWQRFLSSFINLKAVFNVILKKINSVKHFSAELSIIDKAVLQLWRNRVRIGFSDELGDDSYSIF